MIVSGYSANGKPQLNQFSPAAIGPRLKIPLHLIHVSFASFHGSQEVAQILHSPEY